MIKVAKNDLNDLSSRVIEAAINVHNELGPGLLESVYNLAMTIELRLMGIKAENEVPLSVMYKNQKLTNNGFRLDLLIEETLIVEIKSVDAVQPVHKKQLLTYLKLANKPLGLLINFNEQLLKNGIVRIINSPTGDRSVP
jgi:GxxExxY protein